MQFNSVYMKSKAGFCFAFFTCVSIYTDTPLQLYQCPLGEVLGNGRVYPIIALHIGYNFCYLVAAFRFVVVINGNIKIYYLFVVFNGGYNRSNPALKQDLGKARFL